MTVNIFRARLGAVLIALGFVFILDTYLKTGWLSLLVIMLAGLFALGWGLVSRQWGMLVLGGILGGLGTGGFLGFSVLASAPLTARLGLLSLCFGAGWLLIAALSAQVFARKAWWSLVPGGVFASLGAALLFTPLRPLDFVLYLSVGLGLALLLWGLIESLFGLIIPGCLVASAGPSIYSAWALPTRSNHLAQTGIMLVGLALGWGLITLFSRRVTHKFVWWPLIPGGVLAMVGWGLYIGGDPGNALSFIGNTGSIGLMLFGLYLLLLRRGIQK